MNKMLLHSKIIGQGEPLIILHGFLGAGDNWKTLANNYANAGFEVHLVDQRNHGRSFHSNAFSYVLMADDLKAYCQHYHLEGISIIGHSMGGKTAMYFATTYPHLCSKLIIVDIAPKYYPSHHQDILKGLQSLDFEIIKSRKQADDHLSDFVSEFSLRQFLLKNLYWIEKGQLALRINLKALIKNIDEIGKALPEKLVFNGRTLFLKGEKSNYITIADEALIKQSFPQNDIDAIADAGHWLHAENSKDFYQKTLQFLKEQ